MAYLQDDNEAPGVAAGPNAGAAAAGGAGAGAGAAPGGGGSFIGGGGQGATSSVAGQTTPTPTSPAGGYTNLMNYIGANQSGGATTGQAAENVVQQSANNANAAQTAYSTDANADISGAAAKVAVQPGMEQVIAGGGVPIDASKEAAIKSGTIPSYTASYTAAPAGSSGIAYSGPTDTNSFTNADTKAAQSAAVGANKVVTGNAANATGGSSGVGALLSEAYQNPSYTAGEQNLDAFLAGGTAGGQAALGQAAGVNTNTQNNYAGINAALTGKISAANTEAAATNTQYANDIANANKVTDATNAQYASDAAGVASAKQLAANAGRGQAIPVTAPAPAPSSPAPMNIGNNPIINTDKNVANATSPKSIISTVGRGKQVISNILSNPSTVNSALNAGQPITAPVTQLAQKGIAQAQSIAAPVTNYLGARLAHGGEVPSYSQILKYLKEKK